MSLLSKYRLWREGSKEKKAFLECFFEEWDAKINQSKTNVCMPCHAALAFEIFKMQKEIVDMKCTIEHLYEVVKRDAQE